MEYLLWGLGWPGMGENGGGAWLSPTTYKEPCGMPASNCCGCFLQTNTGNCWGIHTVVATVTHALQRKATLDSQACFPRPTHFLSGPETWARA